ncbi:MAG: hypothetical protein H7Y38_18570, partial [Armatimonadetes bacterium]|nr:hypothetical protein [Armatimonadota bacterium]
MTSPDSLPPAPAKRFALFLPAPVALLLGVLFAFTLLFVYRRYSLTFGTGDDHANMLLEGEAFLRGNYLLSHWYLTTVTWYTTDIMLYAIGIRLRGMDPVLMHEVPAVVFATMVCVVMYLAARNRDAPGGFRWQGAVVAFALIGLPLESLASHLLLGPWRSVSILIGLIAFALIGKGDRSSVALWRLAALFVMIVIVIIADNFPLYVIVAPVLIVCALRAWQLPETRRAEAGIAIAVLLGVVVAKLCLRAIPAAGGFTVPDTIAGNIRLVEFDNIGRNFGWTVHTVQVLYGADFWGLPIGLQMVARFLRLLLIALVFWGMVHTLRPLTRRLSLQTAATLASTDRVDLYLALAMMINLLAYWLTNIAYYLEAQRYLVLFCVFGATLAGRVVSRLFADDAV